MSSRASSRATMTGIGGMCGFFSGLAGGIQVFVAASRRIRGERKVPVPVPITVQASEGTAN